MERKDRVAGEFLEQPVIHHDPGAAEILLGRLEDQVHGAVEILPLGDDRGRPEQHGGMPVMAAGMHHAGGLALVFEPGFLEDRQRIEIGTDADASRTAAVAQRGDDARLGKAAGHFIAQCLEPLGNIVRCVEFRQADLRVLVEMMAGCHDVGHMVGKLNCHEAPGVCQRIERSGKPTAGPPARSPARTPHGVAPGERGRSFALVSQLFNRINRRSTVSITSGLPWKWERSMKGSGWDKFGTSSGRGFASLLGPKS